MAIDAGARDPAQVSLEYAASFVDELARHGMAHCVVCPGSRSTPLTLAFERQPGIKTWTHIDERSAAFFALGMAKALRAPVAVVCTSGTAAANFLPAVVEAKHSCVQLVVLTADRPPELRDTGALQAIDQIRLYGGFVKWFFEMALPEPGSDARRLARSIAAQAVTRAQSDPFGPVHVNFPLREPLVPADTTGIEFSAPVTRVRRFLGRRTLAGDDIKNLASTIALARRGLLVCGPQDDPEFPSAIFDLGRKTGFPILADPLSQLRCGHHSGQDGSYAIGALVVDNYDIVLRDPQFCRRLQPDLVLRFGMTPTSKALVSYLALAQDAMQVTISSGGTPNDPTRSSQERIDADPASTARALAVSLTPSDIGEPHWRREWRHAGTTARVVVEAHLAAMDRLCEPKIYPLLAELLPPEGLLYVGNSMPVRDVDAFFPARAQALRILGNRGVNGIDGVVSSALGAGAGLGRRVVLVIGDLSFYHDMNGLLATKLHGIDATIVLLNNDGGGIFHFLPQVDHSSTFEPYFAMPTGLDFRPAVEMYRGRFRRSAGWEDLRHDLVDSWTTPGLTVIEIRTNRDENVRQHRAIWDAVTQAIDESFAVGG